MGTTSRYARLKQLTAEELRLLAIATLLLPMTALGLHLWGYRKTSAFMSRFLPGEDTERKPAGSDMPTAEVTARMVGIAARRGLLETNCLKRALVTWWLLARKGIASEIKFGINKKVSGGLHAHAWVECGGRPLAEPVQVQQQFTVCERTLDC